MIFAFIIPDDMYLFAGTEYGGGHNNVPYSFINNHADVGIGADDGQGALARTRRAAHRDAPSAEQALAALRENHRQIHEMVAAPGAEPAPAPTELAPSPRSEVRPFTPTTINPAKTSIAYECA